MDDCDLAETAEKSTNRIEDWLDFGGGCKIVEDRGGAGPRDAADIGYTSMTTMTTDTNFGCNDGRYCS